MRDGRDVAITAVASAIPDLLRQTHVPGVSLALVRDATVASAVAWGLANLEPPPGRHDGHHLPGRLAEQAAVRLCGPRTGRA